MLRIFNPLSWFTSKESKQNMEDENKELIETIRFDLKYLKMYIKLLTNDSVIKDFLHFDTCHVLADKYLLAITFAYFIRADLKPAEYTRFNFFSALYLAHAMEEDDETLKELIVPWSDGRVYRLKKRSLTDNYIRLWHRMEFRTLVNKTTCETVIQAIPNASIWQRFRPEIHAGAYRSMKKCIRCYKLEQVILNPFSSFVYEDDLYTRPMKRLKYTDFLIDSQITPSGESDGEVSCTCSTQCNCQCNSSNEDTDIEE